MKCIRCGGTGEEPGCSSLDRLIKTLSERQSSGNTREVYKTQNGGWAITYGGGDVPASVVKSAIERGIIVDAYAGHYPGAYAGVGYALPSHVNERVGAYRQRKSKKREKETA